MTVTIYIDVLFFTNYLINFLLIASTCHILRFRSSIIRLTIGSAICALYSVIMFFPPAKIIYTIPGRIIFTALFVMIFFKDYRLKNILKNFMAFAVVSFIFCGLTYLCIITYNSGDKLSNGLISNGVPYINVNIYTILISICIAYLISILFFKLSDRNMSRNKIIYNANITFGNTTSDFKILCDTGCELSEPLSGKPVILIGLNKEFNDNDFLNSDTRYIGFKTASSNSNANPIIKVFKPDKIFLDSKKVTIKSDNCYVGFVDTKFSDDNLYNAVANPKVFEELKEYKTTKYTRRIYKIMFSKLTSSIKTLKCKFFNTFLRMTSRRVHYIGGSDTLPEPLNKDNEKLWIDRLCDPEYEYAAKQKLTEHNLRLVVYIAKKFDSTGIGIEDLISIGTIGLIKAINTFKPEKNIKLATYASRCIENEILMYLRKNSGGRAEVSIDEPLNVDWDGNELLLSDILGTASDVTQKNLEDETDRKLLRIAMEKLSNRERNIVELRFGINKGGEEKTQKEVADMLGISQSYISRLEKRIILRLRRDMEKMING